MIKGTPFDCQWCGSTKTTRYARTGRAKFCDQQCYHAWREATKGPPQKRAMATCHPERPLAGLGLCSTCYARQDRAKNAEKYKQAGRRYSLKKFYGMALDEYDVLFAAQGGLCLICSRPVEGERGLAVDHCHKSGKVRGLLCRPCNSALGLFEDSIERMQNAIAYVQRAQ